MHRRPGGACRPLEQGTAEQARSVDSDRRGRPCCTSWRRAALAQDGRRGYADLARDTGPSTSAVHQRVRRLEQRGAVRGYVARIDPVTAGLPLSAFISIQPIDPAAPDDVPARLRHLSAIEPVTALRGGELHPAGARGGTG